MSSEINQLYSVMLELYQQGRLPLNWRQIETEYTRKHLKAPPKRINLLLANGARGEQTDGPLYLRLGKGAYGLITAVAVILNDLGRVTRRQSPNLTHAIKSSQAGETILVYPNAEPYQEKMVFDKALHIKGKWDRKHQIIRSQTLHCFQLQTDHKVTLEKLTFQDSVESQKKKQLLILEQGRIELIDCEGDFKAPLEIIVKGKASIKLSHCQIKAKQIKLDIHKEATLTIENTDLIGCTKSGIHLSVKGQLKIHNSHILGNSDG